MYLIFRNLGLLDSRIGLTVMLTLINLPIVVWMLYTYFREIPGEILEAARMDGASLWNEIVYVLTPMAVPGIASTMLLNIILAWNEAFWTIRLTTTNAAPLTAFIARFSSPQGLFWAKLSAASTLAIAPILIMGWFCAEAAGARPDLRRRQVETGEATTMGNIALENVNKSFGATHDHSRSIDLEIEDGEFVVFVGPSGCGKSTLLRLIAGLEDTIVGHHQDRRQGRDRRIARPSASSPWCSSPTRSTRT